MIVPLQKDEALLADICERLGCAPVQHIGNILVLWREKPEAPKSAVTTRRSKPMTKKQAAEAQEKPRRAVKRT